MREEEKRFPIIKGPSIPWAAIAPYESQAKKNHDQSLERLAQRGGLDPIECWNVMHGEAWSCSKATRAQALAFLEEINRQWNSIIAERDRLLQQLEDVRAENAALRKKYERLDT